MSRNFSLYNNALDNIPTLNCVAYPIDEICTKTKMLVIFGNKQLYLKSIMRANKVTTGANRLKTDINKRFSYTDSLH